MTDLLLAGCHEPFSGSPIRSAPGSRPICSCPPPPIPIPITAGSPFFLGSRSTIICRRNQDDAAALPGPRRERIFRPRSARASSAARGRKDQTARHCLSRYPGRALPPAFPFLRETPGAFRRRRMQDRSAPATGRSVPSCAIAANCVCTSPLPSSRCARKAPRFICSVTTRMADCAGCAPRFPAAARRIDLIDCATGEIACVGRYQGDAFSAEISAPDAWLCAAPPGFCQARSAGLVLRRGRLDRNRPAPVAAPPVVRSPRSRRANWPWPNHLT